MEVGTHSTSPFFNFFNLYLFITYFWYKASTLESIFNFLYFGDPEKVPPDLLICFAFVLTCLVLGSLILGLSSFVPSSFGLGFLLIATSTMFLSFSASDCCSEFQQGSIK